MRLRARRAAHALLGHQSLSGAPDTARTAALVLLAKTHAADLTVGRLTAGELGRWLGVSGSVVSREVRPWLNRGLADTRTATPPGASGWALGIDWRLRPVVEARHTGAADNPLRLAKPDLAVLLRWFEALIGPGWTGTDPGLLARRTGRHAATDRLALLLLALEARPDGRVRLCGGAVGTAGRPAATLARLASCTTADARKTLNRLAGEGVVQGTSDGKLLIPAIAAAHDLMRRQQRAAGRPMLPAPRPGPAPETPGRDQIRIPDAKELVNPYIKPFDTPSRSAGPHADHTPVVNVVEKVEVESGWSGEADWGVTAVSRERVHAREDGPGSDRPSAGSPNVLVEGGPLRGDKRSDPSPNQPSSPPDTTWRQAAAPAPPRFAAAVFGGPARPLWQRITRGGAQRRVLGALRQELAALAELTSPDEAELLLAQRVQARLLETGGAHQVTDPVGWLIGRGLPQRRSCADPACDDGLLLTTGGPCPLCELRITDRRSDRHIAAQHAADTLGPDADQHQLRAAQQEILRGIAWDRADRQARSHTIAAARRAAIAEQRAADTSAAGPARPPNLMTCPECGTKHRHSEVCPLCREWELTDTAVRETSALASAAASGPFRDQAAAHAEMTCRTAMCDAADQALAAGGTDLTAATAARMTAQTHRAQARALALEVLTHGEIAAAEARQAHRTELAAPHPSRAAAQAAADQAAAHAREETARHLLNRHLTESAHTPARPHPSQVRTMTERGVQQPGAHQLAEEDLCADGCGRPALLTSPRCRRCHIAAVTAADQTTTAS